MQALADRVAASSDLALQAGPKPISGGGRPDGMLYIHRYGKVLAKLDLDSGELELILGREDAESVTAMRWGRRCRNALGAQVAPGFAIIIIAAATTPCEVLVLSQLVEAGLRGEI